VVVRTEKEQAERDFNGLKFFWAVLCSIIIVVGLGAYVTGWHQNLFWVALVIVIIFGAADLTKGMVKNVLKIVVGTVYLASAIIIFISAIGVDKDTIFLPIAIGLLFLFLSGWTFYKHTTVIKWIKEKYFKH
jgi:hypothetical protein